MSLVSRRPRAAGSTQVEIARPQQGRRRKPHASQPRSGGAPSEPAAPMQARQALRVATYNIHKGVLRDFVGLRRVARIHELRLRLHDLGGDLIFLQEVQGQHAHHARRFEHWPAEPQDVFLAKSPKLKQSFETAYGCNATYLHGHHGNALLSRYPIIGLENRDVSDHALEKRGVLHCVVRIEGIEVHCFVVHFGLLARSRERQLDALIDWVSREVASDAPLIIAGDFNDWRNRLSERLCADIGVVEVFDALGPKVDLVQRAAYFTRDRSPPVAAPDPALKVAARMVRTARTYPALVPWLRMDRIYQRGFRVSAVRVLRGIQWARLSDHSPLVADLELLDRGG